MTQEKFEVVPAAVNPGQPTWPTHAESSSRSTEEDRAWSLLYAAIRQPSAAEEVTRQLDADLQAKRSHLALYIRAKTTLREQKAEDARNQRIASFARQVLTALVVVPIRALHHLLSTILGVAMAMLPPVRREPAKVRTKALKNDPNYAQAKDRFESSAQDAATEAGDVEESVKAA